MAPFGFMVDGLDEEGELDSDGDRWFQACLLYTSDAADE